MSNTAEDGKLVTNNAMRIAEAMYEIEYRGDVELQVLLDHALHEGKIPYPTALIAQELRNRRIRDLVVATCKCIEALATAINRNHVVSSQKTEQGMVNMSVDHAAFAHALLSAHAKNARRNAEQLKRLTRFSVHPFSLPAAAVEIEKV